MKKGKRIIGLKELIERVLNKYTNLPNNEKSALLAELIKNEFNITEK